MNTTNERTYKDWEFLLDQALLFRQVDKVIFPQAQIEDKILADAGLEFRTLLTSIARDGHQDRCNVDISRMNKARQMQLLLDACDDLQEAGFLDSVSAYNVRRGIFEMLDRKSGDFAVDREVRRISTVNSGILHHPLSHITLPADILVAMRECILKANPEIDRMKITISDLVRLTPYQLLQTQNFDLKSLYKTRLYLFNRKIHLLGDETWTPDAAEDWDDPSEEYYLTETHEQTS